MNEKSLPRWDLSNVYSGLEAADFEADLAAYQDHLAALDSAVEGNNIGRLESPPADLDATASVLEDLITLLSKAYVLSRTLTPYAASFQTTDSYDQTAARRGSELEQLGVRFQSVYTRFEAWIGSLASIIDDLCDRSPVVAEHRQALIDTVEESKFRMEPELEDLASELLVSGGGGMWKLQSKVTSQLKVPVELDGEIQVLPITVVRNLANNPDPDVRKRAFEAEIKGWESIREPVAFALNGVKGSAITMSRRRGFDDVLHASLTTNRMDRETLEALLASMKSSFPAFRRYFRSKAKKLGKERLPWWDLMAPVGKAELSYKWDDVVNFIVEQFSSFSEELAAFARNAFEKNWIDAEPRDGKVGGAFCMSLAKVEESRVLCNFDGSFDQLSTIAHELGHAYHSHCQKGLPILRKGSPMPIAETASIFCETIVANAAIAEASPDERLAILENQLIGSSQVIVDIYSRFLFESEVVKRREKAELSADDFCEIMLDAQRQTYGDGIDVDHMNAYMWLLKPHYYRQSYNFYNFPYAFGLLFGLGVYAIYRREGESFLPRYKELLRSTGEGKIADLAAPYGIDVRSRDFWDASIKVIEEQIDQYCALD